MVKIFQTYFPFNLWLGFSLLILAGILFVNPTTVYADENSGRMAVVLQQDSLDIFVRQMETGETFDIVFPGSNNSDEKTPALSRDGTMVAFATNNNDIFPNDGSFNIVVFMLEGPSAGEIYPITTMMWNGIEKDEFNPTWDPSGGKIAYTAYNIEGVWNDHNWSGETDIYYRDLFETIAWYDGPETDFSRWESEKPGETSLTKIEDGISNWDPAWSQTAADIIGYSSDRDENTQIYVLYGIGTEGEDPGLGGIVERRMSNHPEADSFDSQHPELTTFSYDWGNMGRDDCKAGAEVVFYDVGSNIFMVCLNDAGENLYTDWVNGSYPKLMPGSNRLAFLAEGSPSVYIKTGPSGEHLEAWPSTVVEGFSWSNGGSGKLELAPDEDDGPDVSVNVFGGSVELDTGDLFSAGKDQNQREFDRIDKDIELEIRRIETLKAQAEEEEKMEQRRIEFEKESFYEQIEFQKRDAENNYEQRIGGWDDNKRDFDYQREKELEELNRNFGSEIDRMEEGLARYDDDFEREKKNLEEQHEFGLGQWEIQLNQEEERSKFDHEVWLTEWNIQKDRELQDTNRWYAQEMDRIKLDYQHEINNRIANGENIEDLISDRDWELQDWERMKQDDINNRAADKARELKEANNNREYESVERREGTDREYENDKYNKEREMEDFLYNWENGREREMNNIEIMKRNLENSTEDFNARWDANARDWENQKQMQFESAQMDYDSRIQQINMEIERAEMEWEAQLERVVIDTQMAIEDFDFQIEQMIREGERRKEMVAMDQQQLVDEYSAKQDTLLTEREQIEVDYRGRVEDINRDYENRDQEIENRRQYCMDEGCDEEEIREIIEMETDSELLYQEQLGLAESDYNRNYSNWEFEMRNVSNVIEMGQRENLHEEGDRGFFANPLVGTIKTGEGGWEQRMRDPGFLAIAGLVVTVGATLLQMFRGN